MERFIIKYPTWKLAINKLLMVLSKSEKMKTQERYKKVIINGKEENLPKKDGRYDCYFDNGNFDNYGYIKLLSDSYWLNHVEWYLQPIQEQPVEMPTDLDNAWSTKNVLEKLIWATEYLLHEKDYDGLYHEELQTCIKRGKEILNQLIKIKE